MLSEVIVIAAAWPGTTAGNALALDSVLRLYSQHFAKVHYLCLCPNDRAPEGLGPNVNPIAIPISNSPTWMRFLKSLSSPLPAVTMRYLPVREKVLEAVSGIVESAKGRLYLIIEETPLACFLPALQTRFPDIAVAVHSHDVMSDAFRDMGRTGPFVSRFAWWLELSKIRKFEKDVLSLPARHWTITESDSEAFNRLGVHSHGVLGVCMQVDRYSEVQPGDLQTVVQVGSSGVRKWRGIVHFVRIAWPLVRRDMPQARLVIAGHDSELLGDKAQNIEGLGFVADERDVLSRGQIFINSQSSGSGLQLKSVVAMLSGKTLVSTPMAVTGVAGTNGEQFIVAETCEDMAAAIVALMRDQKRALAIGKAARELAIQAYNPQAFMEQCGPLVHEFISAC